MSPLIWSVVLALVSAPTPSSPPDRVAVREFREVAISPDGGLVAWVEDVLGPEGLSDEKSAIFVARRAPDGSWSRRRVSASPDARASTERDIAWAPDSRAIAFVSDSASARQPELYVAAIDNGIPGGTRPLTTVRGDLGRPEFSPDGSRIAFLWAPDAPRHVGPLEAMAAPSGDVESQVFEQRLAVLPSIGGAIDVVSPPDLYVHDYCWAPDGSRLAGVAAPGAGDANWWTASLHTFDISTHASREIFRPAHQIALPRWSPDGRSIAFVGGLMSDEGSTGGDLFVVPATGGPARNLTPRAPFSVAWLSWDLDSKGLLAVAYRGGGTALEHVPANPDEPGAPREVWYGDEILKAERGASLSLSADRTRSAVVRSSFTAPAEVWTGPTGQWIRVTGENAGVRPAWASATGVAWENDGWHLQGWLLAPVAPAGAKSPMVVQVHGGPASVAAASWPRTETASLVAAGYYVFLPNPRGSYGQGEEFTRANVRDFGYGDLKDILSGVEAAVGKGSIDRERIGIWGWSYGGYMTMWAVTQTRRFRAAVAGAGIANWQSYYGENDIDEWMIPYFGASVYDDPNIYSRSAPITFIKNVATPTLVLAGERDGECPAAQSFEFWHALKTLGVPTGLVIYAGEGHAFRKGVDQRDRRQRTVAWFDKYLKE